MFNPAAMRPRTKVSIVLSGYVGALVIADVAVRVYAAATSGPDRQQYGAMFGFGDSLLFLAVFAIAAVPATAGGLYFLRPCQLFWKMVSAAAIVSAVVTLAASLCLQVQGRSGSSGLLAIGSLLVLVAPAPGLMFLVSGCLAPNRTFRIVLFAAAGGEVAAAALFWLRLVRLR